jgi:nucleotide-binding universal stress UspA family protein
MGQGITRIVVAIDFSPEADLALDHAVAIAARHGAALTIVYADANHGGDAAGLTIGGARIAELAELAAEIATEERAELERRVAAAAAAGIDTDGVIRQGAPDEVIAGVADDLGAELTVIGTHGRTGVKRFFLGSVAERLIKRTPQSSLVVRGAPVAGGAFRRVLVATDFSDAALAALRIAITLAAPDATFDVIHAWQYPIGTWGRLAERMPAFGAIRDAIVSGAQAQADALAARAATFGRAIQVELIQGAAAATIHERAEAGRHDLIAVGTHGHQGVRRVLVGSVAEAVVRHAGASVVVAHPTVA